MRVSDRQTVALIACAASKGSVPAAARALYQSPLFQMSLDYAERVENARAYVLSAEHGLVSADAVLAPYDRTLNAMPLADVRRWASGVVRQLREVTDPGGDRFVVLAGERYRRFVVPSLDNVSVPMEGLGIGRQLQWLRRSLAQPRDRETT